MVYHREAFFVKLRSQMGFCHGHTNGHTYALTQRAGGSFNAGCMAVFGMAGRGAAPLTEGLNVFHRQAETKQVQQGIQQHAAVPCGQHKPVAVLPIGMFRIDFQMLCIKRISHRRCPHDHTGMAAVGALNGIGRNDTNGIGA